MYSVLMVDDNAAMREALARSLTRRGCRVTTAASGIEGLDVLKQRSFDVVITDLIMPEQEGIETIMMIRHERPEVGVIAISGGARSRNFDYLRMAGSLGAAEVIRKPFEAEELLSRLDRLRTASPTGTAG